MTAAVQPLLESATELSEPTDVVLILSYTSWSGAVSRGFIMPEDRLALHLLRSPRVRRLLVCNPYRSVPVKLGRRVLGREDAAFPASADRRLHEPLRLRRADPTRVGSIERSCAAYELGVRREAARMELERPAVITTHPLMAGFGGFEWAGPVTYYTNDDMTAHPPARRWWPAYEVSFTRARAEGRRAVALTPKSLSSVAPRGPAAVLPCGLEPAEWERGTTAPAWFTDLPSPRMLYVGTLDARLDLDQLRAAADARPQGSVVLVGPCSDPDHFKALTSTLNVSLRPAVSRDELRGLVSAADLGLVPHVRTAQTEAMSPLKLYEYVAAGLPVAAADLPGIAGVCGRRVALAQGARDFGSAVERGLALGRWDEPSRRAFIRENAWSRRFDDLLDLALAPLAAGEARSILPVRL